MCGIAGFSTKRNFACLRDSLPGAIETVSHRGPDDSGVFFDEKAGVGLGHRRLSILDLTSAGRQPMASEDGKVYIVHNGEVYNFKEIREILRGYGHNFYTGTDTEVILKAYIQWGIECLDHFTGMFAFVIWDSRAGLLYLVRDRLGIKPLYYHYAREEFLFSSELKALMAIKGFERNIDSDSLALFFHYQYVPAPGTIFENTFKLLPGHYAVYNGSTLRVLPYWSLPEMDSSSIRADLCEEDATERLDNILTQAVSDRLVSDVPLGALLSGGVDSSLVAALMQKASTTPARTFSIGFGESGYNEAPFASKIAAHLGTDHTEFYVTPKDALDVIPLLPEIYDEPFADSSAVPTYLVSKLARSGVTVALSGDGGDEQMAGYVRYWAVQSMASWLNLVPKQIKRPVSEFLKRMSPHWIERAYLSFRPVLPERFRVVNFPDKWEKIVRLMEGKTIEDLYRMTICIWPEEELDYLLGMSLPLSQYEEVFAETVGWPLLSRFMRVDQKTYLPDAMLTKVDRASMAVGLEVRVPLLDHRVVEYTSRLPVDMKYRQGVGKYILKKVLERYVPNALFERPKMGFGVPINRWLRSELKVMLLDYLSTDRLKREKLFNHSIVEKKIEEHLTGVADYRHQLWSILMWEMWRDRWSSGV
ncbi:MAG TPA: asparagine synthase (glutamine-hydrolyzing) [Desulfobacteraceae bacterium]|nr:asparagine synthase (glutamine-hydrolyzing) [Desulfobacteraceae bacterium]HPJ68596.1 asparagine synthase (glutamine-hydrolyzing) [Desulfobacteraceae bacterium]